MRKIRDVLRLKYSLGRSNREIGAILRISHSTVGSYVRRAREAGVSWPLPDDLDDARLEAALYPPTAPSRVRRPEPDWARVHRELARHKGVTLEARCSSGCWRRRGQSRHNPLEVLDDRYGRRGTILASQLPVEHFRPYGVRFS